MNIEIKEMAERLKEHCKTFTDCSGCEFYLDGCTIYGVPSEWGHNVTEYECSRCGVYSEKSENYCPNCGAKMEEE